MGRSDRVAQSLFDKLLVEGAVQSTRLALTIYPVAPRYDEPLGDPEHRDHLFTGRRGDEECDEKDHDEKTDHDQERARASAITRMCDARIHQHAGG